MDSSTFLLLVCMGVGVYAYLIDRHRKRDAQEHSERLAAITARIFFLEQQALKQQAPEQQAHSQHIPEMFKAPVPADKVVAPATPHPVPQATSAGIRVEPAPKPSAPPAWLAEPPQKPSIPASPVVRPIAASAEVKVTPVTGEPGGIQHPPVIVPSPLPAQKAAAASASASSTLAMGMPGAPLSVGRTSSATVSETVPLQNYPAPRRSLIDREKFRRPQGVSLEELVGTNWLPKLAIAILVIGIALFTASKWDHIPAVARIGLFYAIGGSLIWGGVLFERKEKYKVLGRVLIGGGWAISFFTTYAMQHVPAAQILHSNLLDLFLMLAVVGTMVWHTLKYDSQLVTGCAFLLGFLAVNISHETSVSMMAGVILAVGMTIIVLRRQWFSLEVFGILASYLNHFYWLYQTFGAYGHKPFPGYASSVLLVASYWVIFRTSYMVRKISSKEQEAVSTLAALLSPVLFLAVMKYQSFHHEWAFWALLSMGLIEFTLGQLPLARRRDMPFRVLSSLGATLMVIAVPTKFAGSHSLELLWLAGAEAFLLAGVFTRERLFRHFGGIISFLVAAYLFLVPGGIFSMAAAIFEGDSPAEMQSSIVFLVVACLFYGNSHIVGRKFAGLFDHEAERLALRALSFIASVFAVGAVYAWVPPAAVAVVLAIFLTLLNWSGKQFAISDFIYQAYWVTVVAVLDVSFNGFSLTATWGRIPERLVTFGATAGLLYLSSSFVNKASAASEGAPGSRRGAIAYRWAATGLIALLIVFQTAFSGSVQMAPEAWLTPVLWTALALAVVYAGQLFRLDEFKWQGLVLATLSFCWALSVNFQTSGVTHGLSNRLISVSLIALGTYLLVRWSPIPEMRPAYSWMGTALLGYLAFKESPQPWLAVVWIAFAALLAGAARLWKDRALVWQTHLLSALAVGTSLMINLQPEYRESRVQLLSMLITAALLYALNWITAVAEISFSDVIPQLYAWAGSLLVSWLAWYQLKPASVSPAWGLLGLLLFEIGYNYKSSYLRAQGYVALASSFVYIFIANFNTGADVFSAPVLAVALLAIIYFWVYWRLHLRRAEASGKESKIRVEQLLACVGTATVAALVRFEMAPDSVAAGYAALVGVLLVIAWRLRLPVFLYQAMVVMGVAAFRLSMHNLYNLNSSLTYDLTGTLMAILLLAAAIPVAFRLRAAKLSGANGPTALTFLLDHPEQPLFFVTVALMSVFLFLRLQGMMITLSWCVEGATVIMAGFLAKERSFVRTGLVLLMLCGLKVFVDLLRVQDASVRYLAMIGVGAILLVVSYLFAKNRDTLREYL